MTAFCHINSKPACIFCINVFMQGWLEFIFVAFILRLCLCLSVRLSARRKMTRHKACPYFQRCSRCFLEAMGRLAAHRYQPSGNGWFSKMVFVEEADTLNQSCVSISTLLNNGDSGPQKSSSKHLPSA